MHDQIVLYVMHVIDKKGKATQRIRVYEQNGHLNSYTAHAFNLIFQTLEI